MSVNDIVEEVLSLINLVGREDRLWVKIKGSKNNFKVSFHKIRKKKENRNVTRFLYKSR